MELLTPFVLLLIALILCGIGRELSRIREAIDGNNQQPQGEISIMYIVAADNPDVGYSITLGDVTDSEGNVIPDAQTTVVVESSDSSIVEVIPSADPKTGTVHFGAPGSAAITATVSDAQGDVLVALGAQFTVTVGDPANISGGSIAFDTLTEV